MDSDRKVAIRNNHRMATSAAHQHYNEDHRSYYIHHASTARSTRRHASHGGAPAGSTAWRPVVSTPAHASREAILTDHESRAQSTPVKKLQGEAPVLEKCHQHTSSSQHDIDVQSEKGLREQLLGEYSIPKSFLMKIGQVFMINHSAKPTIPHGEDDSDEDHSNEVRSLKQLVYEKDKQIAAMERKMEETVRNMTLVTSQIGELRRSATSDPIMMATTFKTAKGKEPTELVLEQPVAVPHINHSEPVTAPSEEHISQMIQQSIKAALAADMQGNVIRTGRLYPEEYEVVQFPKGFTLPSFKMFDGTGNPRQHAMQYKASCCNAVNNDALLLRLFVTSLTGAAFKWYAELPNDSIHAFAEMEELFTKRFVSIDQKVTVGDLAHEKRKPLEGLSDYIIRWRNLSMKCYSPVQEEMAIDILLKNIDGPIAPHLASHKIKTFQALLSKLSSFRPSYQIQPLLKRRYKTKWIQ